MALMSPVITNVSGLLFCMLKLIVVSSVLGKQFSNIHASLGSLILAFTLAIVCSTAADLKLRSPGAGRLEIYRLPSVFLPVSDEAAQEGFTARAVKPSADFLIKFLRVVIY